MSRIRRAFLTILLDSFSELKTKSGVHLRRRILHFPNLAPGATSFVNVWRFKRRRKSISFYPNSNMLIKQHQRKWPPPGTRNKSKQTFEPPFARTGVVLSPIVDDVSEVSTSDPFISLCLKALETQERKSSAVSHISTVDVLVSSA